MKNKLLIVLTAFILVSCGGESSSVPGEMTSTSLSSSNSSSSTSESNNSQTSSDANPSSQNPGSSSSSSCNNPTTGNSSSSNSSSSVTSPTDPEVPSDTTFGVFPTINLPVSETMKKPISGWLDNENGLTKTNYATGADLLNFRFSSVYNAPRGMEYHGLDNYDANHGFLKFDDQGDYLMSPQYQFNGKLFIDVIAYTFTNKTKPMYVEFGVEGIDMNNKVVDSSFAFSNEVFKVYKSENFDPTTDEGKEAAKMFSYDRTKYRRTFVLNNTSNNISSVKLIYKSKYKDGNNFGLFSLRMHTTGTVISNPYPEYIQKAPNAVVINNPENVAYNNQTILSYKTPLDDRAEELNIIAESDDAIVTKEEIVWHKYVNDIDKSTGNIILEWGALYLSGLQDSVSGRSYYIPNTENLVIYLQLKAIVDDVNDIKWLDSYLKINIYQYNVTSVTPLNELPLDVVLV